MEDIEKSNNDIAKTLSSDVNIRRITKRVEFDDENLKKIEIMFPLYSNGAWNAKEKEKINKIVNIAIKNLFDSDFKKKLDEI